MDILNKRIRERKDQLKLSSAELGRMLFLSASAVRQWVKGDTIPKADMIPEICIALECTPNYLYGFTAQPDVPDINVGDTISRQAAIDEVYKCPDIYAGDMPAMVVKADACEALAQLPSAQPETSRIENALHGKSAEEQYDFIWWLLQNYAMNFTDSRRAAIEWLKGGQDEQTD